MINIFILQNNIQHKLLNKFKGNKKQSNIRIRLKYNKNISLVETIANERMLIPLCVI